MFLLKPTQINKGSFVKYIMFLLCVVKFFIILVIIFYVAKLACRHLKRKVLLSSMTFAKLIITTMDIFVFICLFTNISCYLSFCPGSLNCDRFC